MPVDLEYIWSFLRFNESEKNCPSGVHWDNTWGSLGHNWDILFST